MVADMMISRKSGRRLIVVVQVELKAKFESSFMVA
jgi:hypothetical protein